MIERLWAEKEERGRPNGAPHLSHSRINRYLLCPEQYRLYYVENLRPRRYSASLVFGQVVHQALASFFRTSAEPAASFAALWKEAGQVELRYGNRESWEKLNESGRTLLAKFVAEELSRISKVTASEKAFELGITGIDEPFIGVIDLVGDLDKKKTVVDFKTSGSVYAEHEVALSDQLTAYQLAEPDAVQMALCVLVKTKEPKIEWHVSQRNPDDLLDYLTKAGYVAHEIAANRFYKRPGMWCSWCDFLPVCLKDERKIAETLVRLA
jgi:CRISPR/Cas system-associated exonuclease Cas4 (RecB family)